MELGGNLSPSRPGVALGKSGPENRQEGERVLREELLVPWRGIRESGTWGREAGGGKRENQWL